MTLRCLLNAWRFRKKKTTCARWLGNSIRAMYQWIVYGCGPFIRKCHMQQRKNSKNNRNYLIKCTCPNCINQSEHSYTRVQKGSALMCPHCSKIFTQDKLPLA
ncbi:YnfU family zinc-binding protein [Klebsiella pneumoniae]